MLARGFGGAERSFVDLSQALARRGHDVMAICARGGLAFGVLDKHGGISCQPVTVRGTWDLIARRRVSRSLQEFAPDVVQTHLARAASLGGGAAHALGLPTLAKTHNYVKLKYYRDIDCLVPTTDDQHDYLRRSGIPEARLRQIPNFSSLPAVTTPARRGNNPPIVFALGRFVRKKGFDILLRAFARLAREGVRARLVIAGAGPQDAMLRGLAAQLNIGTTVEFPGWVDAVGPYLKQADLFVLPSRDEPFGIVVLEAMALGIPIVTTRTVGPSEILDDDSAWFVDRDDDQTLARAIEQALADRLTASKRATRALAYFKGRFSESAVVPQYEALYRDLLT